MLCNLVYLEYNAILLVNWILFKPLNNLVPFPVTGTRHQKHVVHICTACNFLYKIRVLWPKRALWKPQPRFILKLKQRCITIDDIQTNAQQERFIPQRFVDIDKTQPLSTTRLLLVQCCSCLDLHQSLILHQRRRHRCLVSVAAGQHLRHSWCWLVHLVCWCMLCVWGSCFLATTQRTEEHDNDVFFTCVYFKPAIFCIFMCVCSEFVVNNKQVMKLRCELGYFSLLTSILRVTKIESD